MVTEEEKKSFNQAAINDNEIVSVEPEHDLVSSKVMWQKPFFCSTPGCQEKTFVTRRFNMSAVGKMFNKEAEDYFQPLCLIHYAESHAEQVIEMSKVKP